MARTCPECSHLMGLEVVDSVEVDVCRNCGGIWFGSDELKDMLAVSSCAIQDLERVDPPMAQQHLGASRLLCPDDLIRLESYHYMYSSPVLLHGCKKCGGFFVEADQLPKMDQAFEKAEHPSPLEVDAASALAGLTAEHEAVMARHKAVKGVFQTLSQYSPGWLA